MPVRQFPATDQLNDTNDPGGKIRFARNRGAKNNTSVHSAPAAWDSWNSGQQTNWMRDTIQDVYRQQGGREASPDEIYGWIGEAYKPGNNPGLGNNGAMTWLEGNLGLAIKNASGDNGVLPGGSTQPTQPPPTLTEDEEPPKPPPTTNNDQYWTDIINQIRQPQQLPQLPQLITPSGGYSQVGRNATGLRMNQSTRGTDASRSLGGSRGFNRDYASAYRNPLNVTSGSSLNIGPR